MARPRSKKKILKLAASIRAKLKKRRERVTASQKAQSDKFDSNQETP